MYVFLGGAPSTGFCLLCDPCHVCMYVTKIDNNCVLFSVCVDFVV